MSEIKFGERIRLVRKNAGCSQKEFCALLDIPQSTLSAYETDRMQPTISTLVKLAEKFSVSIDWLCGIEKNVSNFGTIGSAEKSEPREDNAAPLTGNDEVYDGEKTKRFVDALITATCGFSDDPLFIAAERLLLEALFGYRYILGYQYVEPDCMLSFDLIKEMLFKFAQEAFSGECEKTFDEAFKAITDVYNKNFAIGKYAALKLQLCIMPELKEIFFSCAERVRKVENFISVYTDTTEFLNL